MRRRAEQPRALRGGHKVKNKDEAKMAAANGAAANIGISNDQLLELITAITAGQQGAAGGAAAPISAAALVQPMGA